MRKAYVYSGAILMVGLLGTVVSKAADPPTVSVGPRDDLQAVIDAAGPGDVIEIRRGVYDGPITLNGRSDLTFVGKGTPRIDGGNDNTALILNDCSDLSFTGIVFQNGAPNCVFVTGGDSITFEKCRVTNSDDSGMEIDDSQRITIDRCKIQRTGNDGIAMSDDLGVTTDDSLVVNTKIKQCRDDGIDLNGSRNQFIKVSIKKVLGDGFDMDGGDGNRMESLKIIKPLGDGLHVDGTNTLITNCKVVKAGGDGVDLDDGDGNIVENSKIIKASENGIEVDTRNNVIRNNKVKGSGGNDLRDRVDDGSNTFTNNKHKTSNPPGLQ